MNHTQFLQKLFLDKRVCIVGFGLEGRSTYKFIRHYLPNINLTIIDKNDIVDKYNISSSDLNVNFSIGNNYINSLHDFDIIIKSPGIPSNMLPSELDKSKITSQADIFLQMYGNQVIGVTGTKGKSTTSSLIHHILSSAGFKTLLVGNIGIPPLDCIPNIDPDNVIVMEMSSHQLEFISVSPHIGILLNLFPEHLDHYHSYTDYQTAKFNIGKYQNDTDYFFCNVDNPDISAFLQLNNKLNTNTIAFSLLNHPLSKLNKNGTKIEFIHLGNTYEIFNTEMRRQLPGDHNLYNIMVAAAACFLNGVAIEAIANGIATFKGLEHRIEPVGEYAGIRWYNDSIATIPEATIAAVITLKEVNTLILGGNDKRKIEFRKLYDFLSQSDIEHIIFTGEAGKRMMEEFADKNTSHIQLHYAVDYKQVVLLAAQHTQIGKICLLSPAASSYDMFRNFEERGKVFKQLIIELEKK